MNKNCVHYSESCFKDEGSAQPGKKKGRRRAGLLGKQTPQSKRVPKKKSNSYSTAIFLSYWT